MSKRKRKSVGRPRKARVSLAPMPFGGDHGTGTAAATAGTKIEALTNDDGKNPNNMGRRRRVNVIETMTSLTMRQLQAAQAIEEAYCRVEMLSSGGELKEQVDASPRPDAAMAAQVDAQSQWVRVMSAVPTAQRHIVEWVCCHNRPLAVLAREGEIRPHKRFASTMDRVADHMGY